MEEDFRAESQGICSFAITVAVKLLLCALLHLKISRKLSRFACFTFSPALSPVCYTTGAPICAQLPCSWKMSVTLNISSILTAEPHSACDLEDVRRVQDYHIILFTQ